MMSREERAKQFLPFDALKGLREELKKREDSLLKVEKKELSDERKEELSYALAGVEKDRSVRVIFYYDGQYYEVTGKAENVDYARKYVQVGEKRIPFNDLYALEFP